MTGDLSWQGAARTLAAECKVECVAEQPDILLPSGKRVYRLFVEGVGHFNEDARLGLFAFDNDGDVSPFVEVFKARYAGSWPLTIRIELVQ